MADTAPFQILSSMITPAVLISAAGLLVLSTSNRLSRVVDRVRSLADKSHPTVPHEGASEAEFSNWLLEQLGTLARRASLLRSALTSLYLSITFFVFTSLALGIVSPLHPWFSWIPVSTGLIGSCILLYGSVLLIQEGRLAIDSTLKEMTFVRRNVEVRPNSSKQ